MLFKSKFKKGTGGKEKEKGQGFKISSFFPENLLLFLVFCKTVQHTQQGSEIAVLGLRRVQEWEEEPTGQARPFFSLNWQLMVSSELLNINGEVVDKDLYARSTVNVSKGLSQK